MKNHHPKLELVRNFSNRRALIINPRFQLQFLLATGVVGGIIIGGIYYTNYYFIWKFWNLAHDLRLPPDHLVSEFLRYEQRTLDRLFLEASATILFVLTAFGLILSHKIAGPLFQLTQHLKKDRSHGKRTSIEFRKDDFFQEVAAAYNGRNSQKNITSISDDSTLKKRAS
jgi:hypothetical protein